MQVVARGVARESSGSMFESLARTYHAKADRCRFFAERATDEIVAKGLASLADEYDAAARVLEDAS